MSHSFTAPQKDPEAVLDYEMDWSDWLAENEAIMSQAAASDDPDIIVSAVTQSSGVVRFRVGGGISGKRSRVTIEITTSAGQVDQRTVLIPVRDR